MANDKPQLIGRYWYFPDGSTVRYIAGGKDGDPDPPADPPTIDPAEFKALQTSVEKLTQKNRELIQAEKEERKKAEEAAAEAAKKSGDVDALEKSWQEKLANETKARDDTISGLNKMMRKMTSGAAAQNIASEIALPGSAEALIPHIERRLNTELKTIINSETGIEEIIPIVRVLGKDGKPSALSLADLKAEIEANKAFAPLLVGSKASGSGDVGKKGDGGKGKTITRTQFDGLGAVERMAFFKEGGKVVDA